MLSIHVAVFFLCCVLFLYCDAACSWLGTTGRWQYALQILLVSPVAYCCFAALCRQSQLSVASPAVNLGMAVGGVVIGVCVNKDSLDLQQKLGIGCAFLAMCLLLIRR